MVDEELFCIYFPTRDKYQAAEKREREAVPGLMVFRQIEMAMTCMAALDKPGAFPKKMKQSEMVALCKERGFCGSLMFMDDPDHIETVYF
jgi:hypothetical protein